MTAKKEIKRTRPMIDGEVTTLLFETGAVLNNVLKEKFSGKKYDKLSLAEADELCEYLRSMKKPIEG